MRKQIGLRMKDETRDQLERVRGSLSRTDYIEGAVLAQIARDLKKTEPICQIHSNTMPCPFCARPREGELRDGSRIEDGEVYDPISDRRQIEKPIEPIARNLAPAAYSIRPSAESKAGVLPVPKKAQKGRK